MKAGLGLPLLAAAMLLLVLCGCGGTTTPSATPIVSPPEPRVITVAIGASPDHLGASETYNFTATVSNATDNAVTWSISSSCTSGCGTISDTGVYTAPSFIPNVRVVYITATSRADTSKSAWVGLVLRPVSVSLAPDIPGSVLPGGTRSFTATLDHDPKNAGVTWTLSGADCSGDGCGTISNITDRTVVYHAPAVEPLPHLLTLAATSVTDPAQKVMLTFSVSASSVLLQGKYAFLINGFGLHGREAIAGQFTVDGPNLTGVWDANRGATADIAQPITGTYSIQPDGHGNMTIQAGSATFTYILSMDSARTAARLIETTVALNESRGSSGYMVRQDANWFSLAALQGDRVVAVYGDATGSHVAALGRFTGTGSGALNNGVIDLSWDITSNSSKFPNSVALAGTFGAPDASSGRGTVAMTVGGGRATYHFTYYIVSQDRLLLVQTDARGYIGGLLIPMLSGEVRYQNSAGFNNGSLNAPFVFHLTNADMYDFFVDAPLVRVGQMVPNSVGALSMTFDQNVGGTVMDTGPAIRLNATGNGTYSVSENGRATWSFQPHPTSGINTEPAVAYLVDQNRGYYMVPDADGAAFGVFGPQTAEPFNLASLAGSYMLNTGPPTMAEVNNDTGWMNLDSNGHGTATLYVNAGSGASPRNLTAIVTIASNGRGTLVLDTTPPSMPQNLVFWAISPDRWFAISTVNSHDTYPALLHIERDGS